MLVLVSRSSTNALTAVFTGVISMATASMTISESHQTDQTLSPSTLPREVRLFRPLTTSLIGVTQSAAMRRIVSGWVISTEMGIWTTVLFTTTAISTVTATVSSVAVLHTGKVLALAGLSFCQRTRAICVVFVSLMSTAMVALTGSGLTRVVRLRFGSKNEVQVKDWYRFGNKQLLLIRVWASYKGSG
jgi:hypothetical protein